MLDGLGWNRSGAGTVSRGAGIRLRRYGGSGAARRRSSRNLCLGASPRLPAAGGFCAWLLLSNGLYRQGPIIHPITAIGPMVIFSQIHDLLVQPESWFELGNPNIETICIDLAYRWPGGSFPVFTSGDSASGSVPRIIAAVLRNGCSNSSAMGVGNTGSMLTLWASVIPGRLIGGTRRSQICPTGYARSPVRSCR